MAIYSFRSAVLLIGVAIFLAFGGAAAPRAQGVSPMMPDEARVREIAAMLSEKPAGLGRPIDDRAHWDELARTTYVYFLQSAGEDLGTPIPTITKEFYLKINKSGDREEWYGVDRTRSSRFRRYVLAECLENKGRFLPRIEQGLAVFFSENTWYCALHKGTALANFEGRENGIDLHKSMRTWEIALTDWLLGSRLKAETRQQLRENLERRTFSSFRKAIRGEQKADWWYTTTNNWNAVCLSGPVGAALTMLDSREDRAFFVAAGEKMIGNFLKGYPDDGYCTEGLGYWNFGFGHYVSMTEAVYQATGGKMDMLNVPNIRNIALFGARIEIQNGVYPAIADCSPNSAPSAQILYYTSRRLGLGLSQWDNTPLSRRIGGDLYETMIQIFPNSADAVQPAAKSAEAAGKRSYFESTGILLCRPGDGSKAQLAACLKGGHNAEHHNHNDVGTFIVAVGNETPIMDIGAEVYTHDTFSAKRYESDALSSYGHSTPVVAGKFQKPGRDAEAKVTKSDFTDTVDTLAMDLRAPYDVADLKKLDRTFVYSREGEGSLTVTDEVVYSSAQAFEVGLMTLGAMKVLGPRSVLFYSDRCAARVDIEAEGGEVALRTEDLKARLRGTHKAKRLGVAFAHPVEAGKITMRIAPAEHPFVKSDATILNGGFEQELAQWKISEKVAMSSVSSEQAASGKYSLKVVDTSDKQGSSAFSNSMRMIAGRRYELHGKFFGISGEQLGVVTRFYDAQNRMLEIEDDAVRLSGSVMLGGSAKEWKPFAKRFVAPEGTYYARIWIHSFGTAKVEGYLDDLDIVEVTE